MPDCIASYHLNPWTCGIAKWNTRLAREVGVPLVSLLGLEHTRYVHPLLSLNVNELAPLDALRVEHWLECGMAFDVFLHGFSGEPVEYELARRAARVFCANAAMQWQVKTALRADAIEVWCPSTIEPMEPASGIRIFTFGMANKLTLDRHKRLRGLLGERDYTVELSTAVHEGTPWDGTLATTAQAFRAVYGDKLRVLGYLADDAVSERLQQHPVVAAFFRDGVRANNTTVWAALEHGCPVITNLDKFSPAHMDQAVYNIDTLTQWSDGIWSSSVLRDRWVERYAWSNLIRALQCAS